MSNMRFTKLSRWRIQGSRTQSMDLPLSDAGAGIANLGLAIGSGSATFTRASTGMTKLASGLWASVASGQPRFCYIGRDTTVQSQGGFLSELGATQLVTPTAAIRDMTDPSWVKVTMNATKTATGIDGAANSATTLTAAGASSTILQTLVAAASQRTYHAFIKRRTGTGTITLMNGTATLDITALINSSTYTRVPLPGNDLNAAYGFTILTSGDAIDVDYNQFEAGAEATSPIDTAGATRPSDSLTFQGSGNIDYTQGACYAEIYVNNQTGSVFTGAHTFVTTIGGAGQMLCINNSGANTAMRVQDGTNSVSKTGLTDMSTGMRKRASSWGAAGIFVTGDGLAVASSSFDGAMGSGNIAIGVNGNNSNIIIKSVKIYPVQLTNSDLQALTA